MANENNIGEMTPEEIVTESVETPSESVIEDPSPIVESETELESSTDLESEPVIVPEPPSLSWAESNRALMEGIKAKFPSLNLSISRPILYISVGIFVVALIAFGTTFYYMNQSRNQIDAIVKAPTPTPHPKPVDPTTNWKTYTNAEYGFQFKYPETLYDKSKKEGLFIIENTALKLEIGGVKPEEGVEGKDYVFSGYRVSAEIVSKKDLVVDITTSVSGSYSSTKLNTPDLVAYWIDVLDGVTCGPSVYIDHLKLSDKYVKIDLCSSVDEKEYQNVEKLFIQILATVKFIERSAQFCGGIAGKSCPSDYTCAYEGNYPDAGGICVKKPQQTGACIQVITQAKNPVDGKTYTFPTPCDVPNDWSVVK